MPRLLVIEANEVPPKVFQHFAALHPNSAIAGLIRQRPLVETEVRDVNELFLYPAQSWAGFNTGLPYQVHQVHWYNDVKDYRDFFWHAIAAAGHSTVLVNTLHTSPLEKFAGQGNYKLIIPDCFAPDSNTVPARFSRFQEFNVAAAVMNGRKSFRGDTLAVAVRSFLADPRPSSWGIGLRSLSQLLKIGASAAGRRPERLRFAQFPVLASIFLRGMQRHRPDLGVLFTNHVAAMMHRYWYATFPEDYGKQAYPPQWVERYRDEILAGMRLLDDWVGRLTKFAHEEGYTMLVSTSMGQTANQEITRDGVVDQDRDYRIRDPDKFMARLLGEMRRPVFESCMVPQYTFAFATDDAARLALRSLRRRTVVGLSLRFDLSGNKLTVTLKVQPASHDTFLIDNQAVTASDLGIIAFDVDDHYSGRHHPVGSVLVANDPGGHFASWRGRFDYLDYAPTLRRFFNV